MFAAKAFLLSLYSVFESMCEEKTALLFEMSFYLKKGSMAEDYEHAYIHGPHID